MASTLVILLYAEVMEHDQFKIAMRSSAESITKVEDTVHQHLKFSLHQYHNRGISRENEVPKHKISENNLIRHRKLQFSKYIFMETQLPSFCQKRNCRNQRLSFMNMTATIRAAQLASCAHGISEGRRKKFLFTFPITSYSNEMRRVFVFAKKNGKTSLMGISNHTAKEF